VRKPRPCPLCDHQKPCCAASQVWCQSKYCPLYNQAFSWKDWQKLARRDPLAPAKNRVVKAAAAVVSLQRLAYAGPILKLRFRRLNSALWTLQRKELLLARKVKKGRHADRQV